MAHPAITHYELAQREGNGNFGAFMDIGLVLAHTVTGLTNGTQYDFRVLAVNAIGDGDFAQVDDIVPREAGDRLLWNTDSLLWGTDELRWHFG